MSKKREPQKKREPPIQLRAGSELGRLIVGFASDYGLAVNDAAKRLVSLALVELDSRYYLLLSQMATAMEGRDAFTRACVHVHAALAGARRATGAPLQLDPERARFILRTVKDFLAGRGLPVRGVGLSFLPAEDCSPAVEPQDEEPPQPEPERVPVRVRY